MEQKNNIKTGNDPMDRIVDRIISPNSHNQRNLLEWRKQTLLLESNGFLPVAKRPYFRLFSNPSNGIEIELTVDILETVYIFSAKATQVSNAGKLRVEMFDVSSIYAQDVIEHVSKLYRKQ